MGGVRPGVGGLITSRIRINVGKLKIMSDGIRQ
jgi:hypothetical protein